MKYKDYVGVFDSGVGGISVLKELTRLMPQENFYFFGDSANAPYGEKKEEVIRQLSMDIVEHMLSEGVKMIVIACNTASSVAAQHIREKYPELPVIAIEPAIRPAALSRYHDRVLVMATPVTLKLEKFQKLSRKMSRDTEFISLPCPGLAGRIEKGDLEGEDLQEMLEGFLTPYVGKVDSVVLGCTHYPFIRKNIRRILGDIPMFDGGEGTARECKRVLMSRGLLLTADGQGKLVFASSRDTEEEIRLYQKFYQYPTKDGE